MMSFFRFRLLFLLGLTNFYFCFARFIDYDCAFGKYTYDWSMVFDHVNEPYTASRRTKMPLPNILSNQMSDMLNKGQKECPMGSMNLAILLYYSSMRDYEIAVLRNVVNVRREILRYSFNKGEHFPLLEESEKDDFRNFPIEWLRSVNGSKIVDWSVFPWLEKSSEFEGMTIVSTALPTSADDESVSSAQEKNKAIILEEGYTDPEKKPELWDTETRFFVEKEAFWKSGGGKVTEEQPWRFFSDNWMKAEQMEAAKALLGTELSAKILDEEAYLRSLEELRSFVGRFFESGTGVSEGVRETNVARNKNGAVLPPDLKLKENFSDLLEEISHESEDKLGNLKGIARLFRVAVSVLDRQNYDEDLHIKESGAAKLKVLKLILDNLWSVNEKAKIERKRRITLLDETVVWGKREGMKGKRSKQGLKYDWELRRGSRNQKRGTTYNTSIQTREE